MSGTKGHRPCQTGRSRGEHKGANGSRDLLPFLGEHEHHKLAQRYVVRGLESGAPQALSVGYSALLETGRPVEFLLIRWRGSEYVCMRLSISPA